MNVCINRSCYCILNTVDKWLIHLILVSQIGHSVTFWIIRISTKPFFLPSFCLLSRFNPLLVICKLFMALFSFLHKLSFLWTNMLMLVAFFNRCKKMSYFKLTIYCMWLPCLIILIY